MTRYEYIKNASIEEMAEVLCNIIDNFDTELLSNCDGCVATKYCYEGHNGFLDWLNKEAELPQYFGRQCLKVTD